MDLIRRNRLSQMARHQLYLTIATFTFTVALLIYNKCCWKDFHSVFRGKDDYGSMENEESERWNTALWSSDRRKLSGLGSSPPRCTSKCGDCSPCMPVHVSVPPGTPVITEYYPEAWRCKCGNKLYLP